MKRAAKWILLGLVAAAIIAQFVGPARSNPPSDPAMSIHVQASVPADVKRVIERSCFDCHSNDTKWPWYSYVAPVKWVVIWDAEHGREHMNFSEWGKYDTEAREHALKDICKEVSNAAMPLPIYTFIHRGAKLSPAEVKTLCEWTEQEEKRLKDGDREKERSGSGSHSH